MLAINRCRLIGFQSGPFITSQMEPTTAPTSLTPDGAMVNVTQELAVTISVAPTALSIRPMVRCTHFRLP